MMKGLAILLSLTCALRSAAAPPPPFVKMEKQKDSGARALIVGGVEATKGQFPWLVEIRTGMHHCGGTIINDEWVLTAAHCAIGGPGMFTVIAGEHDLLVNEGTEQTRQVKKIVNHPLYNVGINKINDISVWKVSPPFVFDEYVQPGNLAHPEFEPEQYVDAAGWSTWVPNQQFS